MIAYYLVLFIARVLGALPLGWALAIGRLLGRFAFSVVRIRRAAVLANLRHVFGGEKSEAEIKAIAAEAYRQAAMTFVEVLRVSGRNVAVDFGDTVVYDPIEPFLEHQKAGGGLIIMQGHIGNFDFAAYAFAVKGFPLEIVMKKMGNRRLTDMVVSTRAAYNMTVHVKDKETRDALSEALDRGGWLGVVPDQRPRGGRGVEVDFLGKPARIFAGPAVMHLETKAPMVLAWDERLADPRRHHVHFAFLPPYEATGDREADVKAIMQGVADRMATAIRKNPAQYFWFHRLWGKSLPASG